MAQRGRPAPTQPRRPAGELAAHRARLRRVVEPVLTDAGYDLEELTVSRAGRRHLVRVIVDGDGGVNLDVVAVLSRAISAALDAAEEAGGEFPTGEYTLEVSSPGVDRPLTLPRHWRRNVGRLVAVRVGGQRQVTGRVLAVTDTGVELDLEGERLPAGFADLGPGRVQLDFTRVAELGDGDDTDEDDDGAEEGEDGA